jgi:hypothetical protein
MAGLPITVFVGGLVLPWRPTNNSVTRPILKQVPGYSAPAITTLSLAHTSPIVSQS